MSMMGDSVMFGRELELEIGNATSAVLVSLLQTLIERNVLSNEDVRSLLTKAAGDLTSHEYASPVKGAVGIILDDLLPKFAKGGAD
jgi:hypothetical protein